MQAVILGIIQGLTEFLPVSSSGHLIAFPYIFGWEPSGLTFDVALNTGTFLAVLIYFWSTWWRLLTKGLIQRQKDDLKLLGLLILATVPAAFVGLVFEPIIENVLRQPVIAAVMLIGFGLLLWAAEKFAALAITMDRLTWKKALTIGFAQALALIPGVSRSGITMTAGLALGLKKEDAAQFSFLLLAPISLGAALLEAQEVLEAPNTTEMALGAFVAFLVGMAAIHLLLKWIKKYGFAPYVWYRVVLGVVLLVLALSH